RRGAGGASTGGRRARSRAVVRAALEPGRAAGCRTGVLRSGSIEVLGKSEHLPPLPHIAFAMYVPRPMGPAARRLATLVREVVSQCGAEPFARSPLARAAS